MRRFGIWILYGIYRLLEHFCIFNYTQPAYFQIACRLARVLADGSLGSDVD